jgi:nucleotide-binding universal stress UspA family protein
VRIVVGFDRSPAALEALRRACDAVRPEGGTVHIVYVASQVELDATKELDFDAKRNVLLSSLYPQLWKEVGAAVDDENVELDLQVRLAPVHLTMHQRRTAEELLKAAVEYGADRLYLGRQGRPGSVADAVRESPGVKIEGDGPPLVVRFE